MAVDDKELDKIMEAINKKFGEGAIVRLGDPDVDMSIDFVSTGSLNLDRALGGRGLPMGRVVELYGPQMSGKTSIALHVIKAALEKYPDKNCAIIDVEWAINPELIDGYNIPLDRLMIAQPSCGEEAIDIVESLSRSKKFSVIVVDSVSALLPTAEAEADMAQNSIGLQARMMSKALRKLTPVVASSNTLVIFINQIREKVGVLYGSPETTSGGRALAFFASVRIHLRQAEVLKNKDDAYGHVTKCKVTKSKVSSPFKEASFNLIYGIGIDNISEIADVAVAEEILLRAGAWYSLPEPVGEDGKPVYRWQGLDSVKTSLKDNEDIKAMFIELIDKKLGA